MFAKYKIYLTSFFVAMSTLSFSFHKIKAMEDITLSHTPSEQLVPPKVMFFDWNNTLTNSWPFLLEVMNKTITKFDKKPFTIEELRALPNVNMPQAEIITGIFGEERPDVVRTYWSIFQKERLQTPIELDGSSRKLLKLLKKLNIHVAIVSNQEQELLEENIKQLGLREYVNNIVGAIRGQPHKNKPMIGAIIRALEGSLFLNHEINTPHHNWWFVGDGDADVQAALNFSCFPVWVAQYSITPIKFSNDTKVPRGLKVDSLQALLELLEQIVLHNNL